MNIKKKLSIFLLAFVCISTVLVGCGSEGNIRRLIEEKLENEAKPEFVSMLREKTGLDDLDIVIKPVGYETVLNPETNEKEMTLMCYFTFKSDRIDDYFITRKEYNKEPSFKLAKLLNKIKDVVSDGAIYSYELEDGKLANIKLYTSDDITVETSNGRQYCLSNFSIDNTDRVEIDDEWVYYKKHGDYTASNNTQKSSSSSSSSSTTNTTQSYRAVTDEDILFEVWYVATEFVKDELKSPKSADFPRCNDSSVKITFAGNSYMVTGYVDADNSFGAKIRTPFVLVLEKNGDNYKLKECTFLE